MHPKLEEILGALQTNKLRTYCEALHDLRKVLADVLTAKDYRRLYEFTDALTPYTAAPDSDVAFNVRFTPTRQERDGTVTRVGNFQLRVTDAKRPDIILGTFRAVPLSQD